MTDGLAPARTLALLLPLALMAGALGSQYLGGLYPCEMCHWQRWPHYAAIVLAAMAYAVPGRVNRRALVALAAVAIAISGAIGIFHAGVEYHWWEGITACTASFTPGQDTLTAILNAPLVRCDAPQWTLFGISLAGFNALFSLGGAIAIWMLLRQRRRG
ncbi:MULTISPECIES: disulfide bond formation protein B [unclassified Sphingomonas]|jgi:disulfide bond formation protein DsbB|uniref:disulfide bond formation protein B n=1 Tax=unclassified Sphingomonas TaxID=196159 RepID=UPI00082B1470|nr:MULTISPECIES: disulfide bond formation protein B [unclassified Sphingomonas]MCH4894708.1 disulfide bond formation protein B [Sphingomonas sp. SFZ2018-12]